MNPDEKYIERQGKIRLIVIAMNVAKLNNSVLYYCLWLPSHFTLKRYI
jgi:hypothetical protein